jgi:hypothetical protein
MDKVRAKFKVDEIRRIFTRVPTVDGGKKERGESDPIVWANGEVRTVIMSPVYGQGDPDHENTKFWTVTPSGRLELGCANLAAAEMFELGQQYYVDFTKA